MPAAAANEIEERGQPKAPSSGRISTPGVARNPALISNARKITATTTKT
jgi:hypothetical protein